MISAQEILHGKMVTDICNERYQHGRLRCTVRVSEEPLNAVECRASPSSESTRVT